jgi:hypothetical protein
MTSFFKRIGKKSSTFQFDILIHDVTNIDNALVAKRSYDEPNRYFVTCERNSKRFRTKSNNVRNALASPPHAHQHQQNEVTTLTTRNNNSGDGDAVAMTTTTTTTTVSAVAAETYTSSKGSLDVMQVISFGVTLYETRRSGRGGDGDAASLAAAARRTTPRSKAVHYDSQYHLGDDNSGSENDAVSPLPTTTSAATKALGASYQRKDFVFRLKPETTTKTARLRNSMMSKGFKGNNNNDNNNGGGGGGGKGRKHAGRAAAALIQLQTHCNLAAFATKGIRCATLELPLVPRRRDTLGGIVALPGAGSVDDEPLLRITVRCRWVNDIGKDAKGYSSYSTGEVRSAANK